MENMLDSNPKLKKLLYKIFSFLCVFFAVDSFLAIFFFYEYIIIMFFYSVFSIGFLYFAWKLYVSSSAEEEKEDKNIKHKEQ